MFEAVTLILKEKSLAMKTMIIYASTHGCTASVVRELAEKLTGPVTLKNLKEDSSPNFSDYDRVILGGSIHAGQIQRKVKNFCAKNVEALQQKELGLFICGMAEGDEAKQELKNAFPEELHQYAKSEAFLGGEYNFEKMNFVEKFMIKKIAKVEETVKKVDYKAIDKFANRMEKTYAPFLFLV